MMSQTSPVNDSLSDESGSRKKLVLRNLQEALGVDKLERQLGTAGKVVHVYWGTATTGKPHVGYFVPMRKIADFLQAGLKSTWEQLGSRVVYYENVIKSLLLALGVPIDRLYFTRGTSYQLSREYTFDLLRLCGQVTHRDALKAGAEVVKQVESPLLSGLLYPLLQALDEHYLKVDGQFGGVDQRKIFILAEEQLPKLKLGKRWHLMNPMVPGLTGSKMSSSEVESKIDLLDSHDVVERKVLGAACMRQEDGNGVLAFYNYVLLPIISPDSLTIGDKEFFSYEEIKDSFLKGELSPDVLKKTLADFLNELLAKVQIHCNSDVVRDALEKGYNEVEAEGFLNCTVERPLDMNVEQLNVVKKIVGEDKIVDSEESSLRSCVAEGRTLRVTYIIHPKGRFHLGLLKGLVKLKSISRNIKVEATVLISDMEAFLDNEKAPWNCREPRSEYFSQVCTFFVEQLGLKECVRVLKSSEIESIFSREYVLNMYKLASTVTRDETTVCEGPFLSGNLIPLFHALNHHLLSTDLAIMGEDCIHVAKLATKLWSRMKVRHPTQLLFSLIPGCDGEKMSCSSPDFILDPFDTPKQIRVKIARSFCEPQNLKGNVSMMLCKQIVFPLLDGAGLEITRDPDNGGDIKVMSYEKLENEFIYGSNPSFPLHPGDLKNAVVGFVNRFFDPARNHFSSNIASLLAAAFPTAKKGRK